MSNDTSREALISELRQIAEALDMDGYGGAYKIATAANMLEADAQDAFTVGLACQSKQAQQVAVPDGMALVPTEALLDIKNRVNTLATLSLKAERYSLGRAIKQAIADMLAAAAQGEKT